MKTSPRLVWLLSLLLLFGGVARAVAEENSAVIATVIAADDARTAAMKSGDRAALEASFDDALRYAHSNGKVDTKASFMETLASHKTVYESFEYQKRRITVPAPGIALMDGRVIVHVRNGTEPLALDLSFLAVWRQENGQWRFLAWQSCRIPPPATAATGK